MTGGVNDPIAWGVIAGMALIFIGLLVLWAYGARSDKSLALSLTLVGPEAEATRYFHGKLVRWFLFYGCIVLGAGVVLLGVNLMKLI